MNVWIRKVRPKAMRMRIGSSIQNGRRFFGCSGGAAPTVAGAARSDATAGSAVPGTGLDPEPGTAAGGSSSRSASKSSPSTMCRGRGGRAGSGTFSVISVRLRAGRQAAVSRHAKAPNRVGIPGSPDPASATRALLLDLGGLTAQIAQVVQLGPANVAAGDQLDAVQVRRVNGKGALHADAETDLANGEGLADTATLPADHMTGEDLDTRTRALDDLDVHLHRVAGTEVRDIGPQRGGVQGVQGVHFRHPHQYVQGAALLSAPERPP